MHRLLKVAVGLAGVSAGGLMASLAAGYAYQNNAMSRDLAAHPAPGQRISVDGRWMHLHCLGTGSPTVVLEQGLGGSAAHWGPTHRALAATTRTCAYDRAGFGYSESLGRPVLVAESAQRLHALLDAAGETDPVVVVGASWGGIIVRSFYTQSPDRVAAMVLLDSTHEDSNRAYGDTEAVTAPLPIVIGAWTQPLGIQRLTGIIPSKMASMAHLSDDDRDRLVATYEQSHTAQSMVDEFHSLDAELTAGHEAPSLGDIPLLVLQRDLKPREDDMDDEEWQLQTREEGIKKSLQQDLASKSTRGEWRVVAGSGHDIAGEAPQVTLAAILEVVAASRLPE